MPRDTRLYMTFPNDFHRHPKILRLPVDVRWAFVEMNGEARLADNDGVFSAEDAEFMWPREVLDALVGSHPTRPLVQRRDSGEYVIRDYGEHQQTRAERESRAARSRENGSKGGRPRKNPGETQQKPSGFPNKPSGNPPEPGRNQSQSQSPESELETDQVRKSSHVPERASDGLTDSDFEGMVRGLGIDPGRLASHIAEKTGRTATPREAFAVATTILGRGGANVAKPQAYVLGSITKSPVEVQQQLDAGRPTVTARERMYDQHPHYPMPCDKCAAIAAEGDTP